MLLLHKYNAATSFDVTVVSLSADGSALCYVFQAEMLSRKTNVSINLHPIFSPFHILCSVPRIWG